MIRQSGFRSRGRAACYNPKLCREIVGASLSELKTSGVALTRVCVCVCLLGPTAYSNEHIHTKVECPQLSTCTSHSSLQELPDMTVALA